MSDQDQTQTMDQDPDADDTDEAPPDEAAIAAAGQLRLRMTDFCHMMNIDARQQARMRHWMLQQGYSVGVAYPIPDLMRMWNECCAQPGGD